MDRLTAEHRSSFEAIAKCVGISILSSMLAGCAAGVGARIAMRLVALGTDQIPAFTLEGTLGILVMAAVLGIAPGIAYAFVRPRLLGPPIVRGVTFGVLLFVLLGAFMFFTHASVLDADPDRPWIVLVMFGALFLLYGWVIGAAEGVVSNWFLILRRDPSRAI